MAERASDRWISIALSVVLHGALVAGLVYGFWMYHTSRPPHPTLAIEAVVVDPHALPGVLPKPQPPAPAPTPPPAPEPEPVEATGPPEPTPEELAQREQEQKEQEQKEQAAQAEQQRKLEERKQQELADARRQEQHEREQERQAQAEAARKAAEKKHAEELRLAEQKRQEAAQRAADEKARAEREDELKRSLAAEEHSNAVSSGALASWEAQITARIQRAWLRPPSAKPGIECVLHVTQVPGGAVVGAVIGTCNGDQAVKESIEAAAYRASPLPPPPDPSLFERNLEITFKPD